MKHNFPFLLLLVLALASCKDHIDLDDMQNNSKLVVYVFPSASDTTSLSITNSIGVKKYTDEHRLQYLTDAVVSYAVNGERRSVEQQADGGFYVVGTQQAGDRIELSVSRDGYAPVKAATVVPEVVAIDMRGSRNVTEYDPEWQETRKFLQLQATFSDPAATRDYYAVRVAALRTYTPFYSSIEYPEVITFDEPLLKQTSEIDDDFGFETYYYGGLYIFSDQTINGQTYTLHLNINDNYSYLELPLRVELFHLSPEYYLFLKSINDLESNELAQSGFAQLMPTYSNVHGGLGVVGAYAVAITPWTDVNE